MNLSDEAHDYSA